MKLEIKRTELQEIHDIACVDWKKTILKYASRNPFGETIEFSAKEVEEMLKASNAEQLPTVKRIFEVVESFESIQTVEDACKHLGEIDDDVRQLRLLQNVPNLNRRALAGQELLILAKALNDGTELNWEDSNEYKYIPWWYLGKDFRLYDVFDYLRGSGSCAPLHYKSRDLAQYSADNFKEIWKDYMN